MRGFLTCLKILKADLNPILCFMAFTNRACKEFKHSVSLVIKLVECSFVEFLFTMAAFGKVSDPFLGTQENMIDGFTWIVFTVSYAVCKGIFLK